MRAWLESDKITAFTDAGDWPTPDTSALWVHFRTEALSGSIGTHSGRLMTNWTVFCPLAPHPLP